MRLFATLARLVPQARDGKAVVELPDGGTVADLARRLGVPPGYERVALVNGREAEDTHVLAEGDVVTLFPPLAGGVSCPRQR